MVSPQEASNGMRLGHMGKPFVVIRFAVLLIMREQDRRVNVNHESPVPVPSHRFGMEISINDVEYGLKSVPLIPLLE